MRLHPIARIATFGCMLALIPTPAWAQTTISVDINRATLSWQWTQGTGGPVTEFRVKCGTASGIYTLPVVKVVATLIPPPLSLPVKSAIPGPGTYFCVVTAANQFGESGPSNELPFAAGVVPVGPSNLQIIVQ